MRTYGTVSLPRHSGGTFYLGLGARRLPGAGKLYLERLQDHCVQHLGGLIHIGPELAALSFEENEIMRAPVLMFLAV